MDKVKLPPRYQHVMPYLIVNDAEGLLDFMQTVFDATESMKTLGDDGRIRHAEVMIGDSTIMFSNATPDWGTQNAGMYVNVADADKTYAKAIEAGATSIMPPADQSYGRSGGVKDPCGNTWWITTPARDTQ